MRFSSTAWLDFAIKQKFRNNFFCFFALFQGLETKSSQAMRFLIVIAREVGKGKKL